MITTDELVPVILLCNEEYWAPYMFESIKGRFGRYVIYDIGSTDETKKIVNQFIDSSKDTDIFYRELPMCDPIIQGTFRNSMIAEAMSDWYFIVDGDEVYTPEALDALILEMENMKEWYASTGKTYGVVRRVEVNKNMTHAYGQDLSVSHHRIYHRTAIFEGTHPGEDPVIPQTKNNEHQYKEVLCYHFHNARRSTKDSEVPKREKRKHQHTYHPGNLEPIDLLREVPILQRRIEDFPVCPELQILQEKYDCYKMPMR